MQNKNIRIRMERSPRFITLHGPFCPHGFKITYGPYETTYNPYSYNTIDVGYNYPFTSDNTTTTGYVVNTYNANTTK